MRIGYLFVNEYETDDQIIVFHQFAVTVTGSRAYESFRIGFF